MAFISKQKQKYLFPVMDVALNGVNYFFHIFISWYLIPNDYGVLNSLLALSAILLVAGISFQIYTAKESAREDEERVIEQVFKIAMVYSMGIAAVSTLGLHFILRITRSDASSLYLVILIFTVNILLSIYRGVFQGKQEFLNLNISFYIEVVSKIIFVYILIRRNPAVNSVLLSILFGMMASLLHGAWMNKNLINYSLIPNVALGAVPKNLFKVFASSFFFYYFTSIDMLVVNYYIPEYSGVFAVVLKYSQLLMFVSLSIITVFIPSLSRHRENREEFNKMAKLLFLIIGFISLCTMIFYYFVMPLTVTKFFDVKYAMAKDYLFMGVIPYIFLMHCYCAINIHMVLGNKSYLYSLFVGAIVITILLNVYNANILSVLKIESAFYLGLCVVLVGQLVFLEN